VGFLLLLGLAVLYFVPSIVAIGKKHVGAIVALNILLGWTFLGWVVALVWALADEPAQAVAKAEHGMMLTVPPLEGIDPSTRLVRGLAVLRASMREGEPFYRLDGEGGPAAEIVGQDASLIAFRSETVGRPTVSMLQILPDHRIQFFVDFVR
jgi:hypothetical protein